MDNQTKEILWNQFGAAIDTMENAINHCPDEHWIDDTKFYQIWYMASHTIFWLDYYIDEDKDTFQPPEPFGMEEMDPAGVIPDPPYSKEQLLTYLEYGREKTRKRILNMTEQQAAKTYKFRKADLTMSELILYIMRHIQHHAAQMNLLMRQKADTAPGWVFQSKIDIKGSER